MKTRTKLALYIVVFVVVFFLSAMIRIRQLGSAPMKLLAVDWDESVGTIYKELEYENAYGHKYDLYVPQGLNNEEDQYLIVYIHGGSFNSGAKEEFLQQMTEVKSCGENYISEIDKISPASRVTVNSPPTLMGYGLIDHCVSSNQKFYLMDAFQEYDVTYEYIEFPKSNHGMYNDLDKLQMFVDKSLEYCQLYLK